LQALIDERYFRVIPIDPMTKSSTTWAEIRETLSPEEMTPGQEPGIIDVRSGSEQKALDGTLYNTW
jgi:general secretion pathway protein G